MIAGCGGGGEGASTEYNGTSMVSITAGGKGQSVSLRIEKNTLSTGVRQLLRDALTANAALAAIPAGVARIVFTILAPDMITRPYT